MKKIITLLLVFSALIVSAKDYKLGYFIVTETESNGKEIVKTESIAVADSIMINVIDWIEPNAISLFNVLQYKRYVELEDDGSYYYAEVKRINKRGKYRRIKNSHF